MSGFDNEVVVSLGERLEPSTAQAIMLMQGTSTDVSRINYTGDPEGAVSANPSSLCHDPVAGTVYRKATGTGNTGWEALSDSITMTADDGNSLTANPYNVFGQKAGASVPVMSSSISGGNLLMANNAWETQYVVDPSSTNGLKGTFQTIQAALDQAVIDGMTYTSPRKFILRAGTSYTENLTIPGGAYFFAEGYPNDPTSVPPNVSITGNHTCADICEWASNGIQWVCSTGTMFTAGATFNICLWRNSSFHNSGTGLILDASTGTTIPNWYNCQFATGRTDFGTVFDIAAQQSTTIRNCIFNGCGFEKATGVLRIQNCTGVGELNQTSNTNGLIISDSTLFGNTNSNAYGLGTGVFINCQFNNNSAANYGSALAGGATLIGCYMNSSGAAPRDFLDPATTGNYSYVQVGNVLKAVRTDIDYTSSSGGVNYIGVTDTSSARSIEVRIGQGAANPFVDYQVYVVDESGGAATNNITITDVDGALINGVSSYVINANYGAVLLHTDGTNWFATSASKEVTLPTPFTWNNNTAVTSVTMAPNNGYIHNNPANNIQYTLPTTAAVGTIMKIIKGPNSSTGTWQILQNSGQSIYFGNVITTVGVAGTLFGTVMGDSVELVCTVADTSWTVANSVGNLGYG